MKFRILIGGLCFVFAAACGIGNAFAAVSAESPEEVVQRQVEAYNARDIDAFAATYSDDIEIYDATGKLSMRGQEQLRQTYTRLFDSTPDLDCRIVNRIAINNKVIDHENVTMNGKVVEAVAIYEVAGGRIVRVAFVK